MKRVCIFIAIFTIVLAPVGGAASAATGSISTKADNPGKAKGHDKESPGKANGHAATKPGKATAPGQLKKSTPAGVAGNSNSSPRSRNENEKVTFCHVPPGNPANGHLITTSVNAIQPGHVNHLGDIIPPFSFVKHGKTVSFAGQNWDAAGRAALANGCKAVVAATGVAGVMIDGERGQVAGVSLDDEGDLLDAFLPETGGARLAVLLVGLGLVAVGAAVLVRNRRFFG